MKLQFSLLLATTCLVLVSFIDAPYPDELILQHVPTAVILIGLALEIRLLKLSTFSFACIVGFTLLHILGARWIYSFVPYDAWMTAWTGSSLSERFGWERNHYDRLVHLCFGLLALPLMAEGLQRFGNMRALGAALTGIAFVLAIGAIYEVFEWLVAVTLSPSHAEAYNGQQGDPWDAQKDMALQWFGATAAACGVCWRKEGRKEGRKEEG